MKPILGRLTEPVYGLLRLVAGLLFAFHGVQKMFGILGGQQPPFLSQIWFAGVIELVGGVLIAVGLFTSLAAFIASGEMAVAYFQAHAPKGTWPTLNGGELAVLYCFLFLYIAARGGGRYSIDRR
jgi:putative oxidoreductase